MKVTSIRVARTKSDGDYGNRVYEVSAELEEGEGLDIAGVQITKRLDQEVEAWERREREDRERRWREEHEKMERCRQERLEADNARALEGPASSALEEWEDDDDGQPF